MHRTENCIAAARSGFTLVELLVVVAILGILGTIGLQGVQSHIEKTRMTAAKTAVDNIKGAAMAYNIDKKKMPTSLNQLIEENGDKDPYLEGGEGALIDPWDNEYKLEVKGKRITVLSAGPDGQFGTEDDINSNKIKKSKEN